jgi:Xaa-Pro dipeptidase
MTFPELDSIASRIDVTALSSYRLARVQEALQRNDVDAALLYDPINIRYATNSRNMLVWCLHNPVRYCFVPAEGRPVLFEFRNSEHLASGLTIDIEVRPAVGWSYFVAGTQVASRVRLWAEEIADVLRRTMGVGARRLAVDRLDPPGYQDLTGRGIAVVDAQRLMEEARSIKSRDELNCIELAMAVSAIGMQRVVDALHPGISENSLWSKFYAANIEFGGDYIETRLFNSGPRTNPVAHGIGMTYENPRIVYPEDWKDGGCEGAFEENMTLCVESYFGADGAGFGIKYTEQVVVTESGCRELSSFPKEAKLISA